MGSILILLGLFFLSALYVIRPFFEDQQRSKRMSSSRYDSLLAERERLYSSIEDLDLELDLEKISSKDHARNRDLLLKQAAEVLMQLDQLSGSRKKPDKSAISQVKDDDLEAMISARRRELRGEQTRICPQCGNSMKTEDQFCGKCGERL
jgi:hypothetical protein